MFRTSSRRCISLLQCVITCCHKYHVSLKLPFRSQLIKFLNKTFQEINIHILYLMLRTESVLNLNKEITEHWFSYFQITKLKMIIKKKILKCWQTDRRTNRRTDTAYC